MNSVVIWISINAILPLLPILINFTVGKLFTEKSKDLKWYQFLSRDNGLALYSSIISISSLSKLFLSFVSTPNLFDLIDNRTQSFFVIIIIFLGLNLLFSLVVYSILLYRSKTINDLYSNENRLSDEQERAIAFITITLALIATILNFIVTLKTKG